MQRQADVRPTTGPRGRTGTAVIAAVLLAAVPLLVLAGCGGSPGSEGGAETHGQGEGATHTHGGDTHTHAVADTLDAAVPLTSVGDESRVGRVTVLTRGDTLRLHVSLEGAEPGTRHPAKLQSGSCSEPGTVLADLTPVMTGTSGDGSSLTELSLARTAGHGHGAVRISGPSGSSIGCASVHLAGAHEHEGG